MSYAFPYRSGTDTVYLTPEQLPMITIPEVRRVAILLSSIPAEKRNSIILLSALTSPQDRDWRRCVRLDLDSREVTMKNTVRFTTTGQDVEFTIPADSITHTWEDVSRDWIIWTSVKLSMKEGRLTVVP